MPNKKIHTHCTSIELDIHGIFIYIAIYHGNVSIDPYDMYIYIHVYNGKSKGIHLYAR